MKFSRILKGTRAERLVEVPGYQTEDGKPFTVLCRPLTGLEHEDAYAMARARAVEKGVANPEIGDPIYDLALMAFVIAVGCVDPDSPSEGRSHSFDSGEQILKEMHPEQIVHLHEHHEAWQHECSPTSKRIDEANLVESVREVAGPDGLATFMRFSPNTRVSFAISTARTLLALLEPKSMPGSNSGSAGTPSETPSKPESETPKSVPE